jgi:hypothetical protein
MSMKDGIKTEENDRQSMWVKLPKSGQEVKTLDQHGAVHVRGRNPEFAGTPYGVLLGLGVGKNGPIRFGTLDVPKRGDYFYAEVHEKGTFDIRLRVQHLQNQKVTIVWWAIPTVAIKSTIPPTPTPFAPIGLTSIRFKPKDYPGRYVHEVTGIGPELVQRLTQHRMKSLAALASADVKRIAGILNVSEVRAIGFIYEARLLLTKTGK